MSEFAVVEVIENNYNVQVTESVNQVSIINSTPIVNVTILNDGSIVSVTESNPIHLEVTQQNTIVTVLSDPDIVLEVASVGMQGPTGESSDFLYTGPEFTYDVGGNLTQIEYDDGSIKTFEYDDGLLSRIDFDIFGSYTIRKDFVYTDGVLMRIDQTII